MKFSFAISFQTTNFKYIGKDDWIGQAETLSELGYDGVELGIRDPKKFDAREVNKVLKNYSLNLSAIGTGQAFSMTDFLFHQKYYYQR